MKTQRIAAWGRSESGLKNGASYIGAINAMRLIPVLDTLFYSLRNGCPWHDLPNATPTSA